MSKKVFSVIEYFSGFAVRHDESGKESWLSDGVDAFFNENDVINPGAENFVEIWENCLNEDCTMVYEAYFPDLPLPV